MDTHCEFVAGTVKGGRSLVFPCLSKSDRYIVDELVGKDNYQLEKLLTHLEKNPGPVVDVGAHKGYFSLLMSMYASYVYSYEADENNFEILQKGITLNKVKNIKAQNVAVFGHSGKRKFYTSSLTAGRHSFYPSTLCVPSKDAEIPCISLKDIILKEKLDYVSILKLDCEGSEYPIIYTTPDEFFDRIPLIIVEIHESKFLPFTKEPLLARLKALGYEVDVSYYQEFNASSNTWIAFCQKEV